MEYILRFSEVIMMNRFHCKWSILLGVIFISSLLTACSDVKLNSNDDKNQLINYEAQDLSNRQGNLFNLGFVAEDEENVYYTKFEEGRLVLYKYDTKMNSKKKIADIDCIYINVVDDWIYYANYDDNSHIYKMDINGQNNQKICDIRVVYLLAYNDQLYCRSVEDTGNYLYSMDYDGQNLKKLSEDKVKQIYLYNDEIYYLHYNEEHRPLIFKINSENDKELVYKVEDHDAISWFWIYDDDLYYKMSNMSIVKYDIMSGTKETIVKTLLLGLMEINVYKNYVFYLSWDDGIHRLDINTGENLLISLADVKEIFIANNQLFHYREGILFSMNLDGSDHKAF